MKYLLFSDVHGDLKQCEKLVRKSEAVDVVLAAGDFGSFRKGITESIDILAQIKKPVLVVHGNHENHEELTSACRNWASAHILNGDSIEINGITFFGIGGATPVTPFGPWSVDVSEKEAERILDSAPQNCVLISHSPPYKCLDEISPNQHIGNRAIRSYIEKREPQFVVCGHIHEAWNRKDAIGQIPVINAGPFGILFEVA